MVFEIPKKVKGIVIQKQGLKPELGEIEVPQLVDGDILVKVEAAPINPVDLASLQGKSIIAHYKYPYIPGKEASGTVVAAKGHKEEQLIGKRVGCIVNNERTLGAYGEYCLTTIKQIMILPNDVDFYTGACSMVDPLAVNMMLRLTQKKNVRAVVNTVGCSQLGMQMSKLFTENKIDVINIVRREEQYRELKEHGLKYVLNQNDEDFWQVFKLLAKELQARVAFDAIGGEFLQELIKNMPKNSTIYISGDLSNQREIKIDIMECLLEHKTITGFSLFHEMQRWQGDKFQEVTHKISKELNDKFHTEIASKIKLNNFQKGLEEYMSEMSFGKTLLVP
ncbi:GroES (chaperonin 10)-like protein [Pseudocohnilembus persalinus]|uniref:GroES (Chaperonin 10)-like protein n=1 Tax=Pseudocohnilembus persalinus TaxID=266149 RepID=A0A0V0QS06_PSEPJ|nr:GroES (chaperonin 10)-like protein [Pseudocohnilembus persalinus]|eukprot:KRX05065.1 GroES (chaperonin 10)-like protein [Pseudocohnilembus persalinus]